MPRRLFDALAFATIFAVGIAGAMKLSWWTAVVGACGLALISLLHRWSTRPTVLRLSPARVPDSLQFAASTLNGVAAGGAAFMFGHVAATAWGF
jgi:hypothetical protein